MVVQVEVDAGHCFPAQTAELQQKRREGVLIKTLMEEYGLARSSIYRYLNEDVSGATDDA